MNRKPQAGTWTKAGSEALKGQPNQSRRDHAWCGPAVRTYVRKRRCTTLDSERETGKQEAQEDGKTFGGRARKRSPTISEGAGLALLPEHRSRQPRSFPVAIPHESAVHLIWREAELGVYRSGLERLAAKVTHVGHSASFAQVWVEDGADIIAAWEPIEGMAAHPCVFPLPTAWTDSFAPATGPSGSATTIFVARLNGANSTHRR